MNRQFPALVLLLALSATLASTPLIARGDAVDFLTIENESRTDVAYSIVKSPGIFTESGCLSPKDRARTFHILAIKEVKLTLKTNGGRRCGGTDWQYHTIKYRAPDMTIKIDANSVIHT